MHVAGTHLQTTYCGSTEGKRRRLQANNGAKILPGGAMLKVVMAQRHVKKHNSSSRHQSQQHEKVTRLVGCYDGDRGPDRTPY